MLPFMKNKEGGAASGPVEVIEREPDEGSDEFGMLEAIVEDMAEACGITDKAKKKLLKDALGAFAEHLQDMDAQQDQQTMGVE